MQDVCVCARTRACVQFIKHLNVSQIMTVKSLIVNIKDGHIPGKAQLFKSKQTLLDNNDS